MNARFIGRLTVLLLGAAIVIGLGFYSLSEEPLPGTNEKQPPERSEQPVAKYDFSTWDLPTTASVDLSDQSPAGKGRLSIPGTVNFKNGDPRPVRVTVNVQPADTALLNRLGNRSLSRLPGQLLTPGRRHKPLKRTLVTDTAGRFRIDNAPPGLYRVSLSDTKWYGRAGSPRIESPAGTRPLRVTASRYARLSGTVTGSNGQPLSGVTVNSSGRDPVQTSESGTFVIDRLKPDPGTPVLKLSKDGFASKSVSLSGLTPDRTTNRTLVLEQNGRVIARVQSISGGPVDTGTLRLTGLNKNGGNRTVSEKRLGATVPVTFSNVPPGRYAVDFLASRYFSQPVTVTVKPGQTRRLTLTPKPMERMKIGVVNRRTNQPLPFILPDLTIYDGENNKLEPGFFMQDLSPEGLMTGYVHPDMERGVAVIKNKIVRGSPRKITFSRSDLPTVKLPVSTRTTSSRTGGAPATVHLRTTPRLGNRRTVNSVSVFVVNERTGELAVARGGLPDQFKRPFSLPAGRYTIYGLVEFTEDKKRVFFKTTSPEPGSSIVERVTLRVPSGLEGTVRSTDVPTDSLRVGVNLDSNPSTDTVPYLPAQLQTTPGPDGSFRLSNLPPGVESTLLVFQPSEADTGAILLDHQSLRSLAPGERISLGSLHPSP